MSNKKDKINYNLYDEVTPIHKNWIDTRYKIFYSRTMEYKTFYTILKKFNTRHQDVDYFLVLSDETTNEYRWGAVQRNPGKIKCDLKPYWKDINTSKLNGATEINVSVEEKADNAIVYYLDI